jgi:crotonobetainyl-CoA:carnitine CoA-transferase CaiB-like acyl-CoA transferase
MAGLEGMRVLELGHMVSAAYASKVLADLGAEVVKVEEPEGDTARRRGPFPGGVSDPEKSGLFLYLNANKRGVVLDLLDESEKLERLVGWADVLIHNYSPRRMRELGIDYSRFREINPLIVMCSITPFGLTGPYRDYMAYELTIAHGGGWAWLSPNSSDRPDLPPLKAAGHQADFQAGLVAALTSLAAYFRALRSGQGEHIDISSQEAVASLLEQNFVHYTYAGQVASRLGRRLLYPWGFFPCRDGDIFMVVAEADQWQRLIELMGNPEWAEWEIFADGYKRSENSDLLRIYLEEWTRKWTVSELFRAAQARRICMVPVSSMASLANERQLKERNFFVEVAHPRAGRLVQPGAPYRLSDGSRGIRRPAPLKGQDDAEVAQMLASEDNRQRNRARSSATPGARPLEGVRVADFSWAWAGPFCGMLLAHLGAEVIKIESHTRLDLGRRLPIYPTGMEPGPNRCGYFNQWNQGKKSLLLNLRKPEAIVIVKQLIRQCDVVLDNFATGVMERLGLAYEDLKKIKPDIIAASISGFGHSGPYQNYMGYGPAIVAMSGLSSLTGYLGGPPQEVGISYGDPNGGIHAAVAICAALATRERSGRGQHIDVSLLEAMIALLPEGWMEYAMNGVEPPRIGNRDPIMAPHDCFPCAGDDEWVTIACGSEHEWRSLCRAIGIPELADDPRFSDASRRKANEDDLTTLLSSWTRTRTKWEVTKTLQHAGVAAFPSMNSRDLAEDIHLNQRGFFARLPHPEVGVRTHAGVQWRLTNGPNGVRCPAPLLGQHTDWVMSELLGYDRDEIERLRREQVLY